MASVTAPHAYPGLFVSFEGGDGVGKSTQISLLADWLVEQGRSAVVTREPGGTELGRTLRDVILHGGHVDPRAEALLYAADRAHHVATLVRPALERGDVVVTDRYLDSSIAYQGDARALGADQIRALSEWATAGLLPDVTILLDLDPERAAERRSGATPDRLESESLAFHRRVRARFLELAAAEPARFLVLDAGGSPEEIFAAIRERVQAALAQP